jgi:ParB family chromosome partitioning protein
MIPIDAIDPESLARDRAALDAEALAELVSSIRTQGLRMPVEVYELSATDGPVRYGLISGFRRLAAVRALRDEWGLPGHDAIPAFLRDPGSLAEALRAMVEENVVRAEVSPWEQALVVIAARDRGVYETIEAAVDGLYAALSPDRRKRLRAVAHLAEEFEGALSAPETLSLRQLLRLAAAAARGYGDVMRHALTQSRNRDPGHQWRALLLPILAECEDPGIPDPRPVPGRGVRPRRTYDAPGRHLRFRRERTRDGWCLHVTGSDATNPLMDTLFDEIEAIFRPR